MSSSFSEYSPSAWFDDDGVVVLQVFREVRERLVNVLARVATPIALSFSLATLGFDAGASTLRGPSMSAELLLGQTEFRGSIPVPDGNADFVGSGFWRTARERFRALPTVSEDPSFIDPEPVV